jgi:nucleotide-binding universal stress UspA family protein
MMATTGNVSATVRAGTVAAPAGVHTLVVAHDGSTLCGAALSAAVLLARRLGAAVDVLSVVPSALDVDARRAELAAAQATGDVAGPGGAGVRTTVVPATDPVAALHDALAARPGAVACVGSHGAGHSSAAIGSVARDVLARARAPVVVAPAQVDARPGQGVVACVDGGPASLAVAVLAAGWARLLQDDAVAVTVSGTVPTGPCPAGQWAGPEEAEAGLEVLAAQAREHGDRLATRVIHDPVGASSGLCRHLRRYPPALVVVSARSHAGLPWLPLGREAAGIIRHSPAPVLVLPVRVAS